jgi:hypothetical protein
MWTKTPFKFPIKKKLFFLVGKKNHLNLIVSYKKKSCTNKKSHFMEK